MASQGSRTVDTTGNFWRGSFWPVAGLAPALFDRGCFHFSLWSYFFGSVVG